MMWWPLLNRVLIRFSRPLQLPFVCIMGFIGYHLEGLISDRYTPPTAPIPQQREERLLKDMDSASGKQWHHPLEVNLPPSLST